MPILEHEGFAIAEAIVTKLGSKDIPACMDELNFTDLGDLLSAPDTDYFITVSPEEIQSLGYQCRSEKIIAVAMNVQISGSSRHCKGDDLLQELREFLNKVREVRECVCFMGNCDLPKGISFVAPTSFVEVPTDEDLSQFLIRFREIQFTFNVSVNLTQM